jgi:hypothetical protein
MDTGRTWFHKPVHTRTRKSLAFDNSLMMAGRIVGGKHLLGKSCDKAGLLE